MENQTMNLDIQLLLLCLIVKRNHFFKNYFINMIQILASFEHPYLKELNSIHSFDARLALISAQMICYQDRFLPKLIELLAWKRIFDEFQNLFHSSCN